MHQNQLLQSYIGKDKIKLFKNSAFVYFFRVLKKRYKISLYFVDEVFFSRSDMLNGTSDFIEKRKARIKGQVLGSSPSS